MEKSPKAVFPNQEEETRNPSSDIEDQKGTAAQENSLRDKNLGNGSSFMHMLNKYLLKEWTPELMES